MPTEELEQALLEAKWGSAEEDLVEVVARLFKVQRALVLRVAYALDTGMRMHIMTPETKIGEDLDTELQVAIREQLRRGLTRARVRECLGNGGTLLAAPTALITKPRDICNGCRFSLDCVTKNYSTPEDCFKHGPPASVHERDDGHYSLTRYRDGGAKVTPLRIRGDRVTVSSAHPRGTFDVDVGDIWP